MEGVEFVAMPTTTQVYITGNVVSDHKHFPMLKVQYSTCTIINLESKVDNFGGCPRS